jgi:hypothetical protein
MTVVGHFLLFLSMASRDKLNPGNADFVAISAEDS